MKYPSLPVLKEWPHSFSAAPALFVFSNLCGFPNIPFFIAHSNWGCVNITKRMLSALRFWLFGSQTIMHQVLKVCKYIQSSRAASISPTDPVMSLGSSHQNWDEFVIFWKTQWAGTRQRESSKMVSTAYVPWDQLHSPLDVCYPEVFLSGWSSRTSKEFFFMERLGDVLPSSVQCPTGIVSRIATVPGMHALPATRTRRSKGTPWVAPAKTGTPDVKTRALVTYILSSRRDWCSVVWQRENTEIIPAL